MRHVLLASTLLLTVACGGDGGDDKGGDGGPTKTTDPPVMLPGAVNDHGMRDAGTATELVLGDYFFEATYLRSSPNAVVNVRLKNTGEVPHTFTITDRGVDETVQPGATVETSVTLPTAGAVRFFCRFHEGQAMQGAFYFNPGDPIASTEGGAGTTPGGTGGTGGSSAPDGDGAYNQ